MKVFPTEVRCNIYSRNVLLMSVMLQLCTPKHGGGDYLDRAAHQAVTSISTWDLPWNAQNPLRWGGRGFIPLLWLAGRCRLHPGTHLLQSHNDRSRCCSFIEGVPGEHSHSQHSHAAGGVNTMIPFHRQTFGSPLCPTWRFAHTSAPVKLTEQMSPTVITVVRIITVATDTPRPPSVSQLIVTLRTAVTWRFLIHFTVNTQFSKRAASWLWFKYRLCLSLSLGSA